MKRIATSAIALIAFVGHVYAQKAIIPIHVVQPGGEFEDQALKDRRDSTRDLVKALEGKERTLVLVNDGTAAKVQIEVLGRGVEVREGASHLQQGTLGGLQAVSDKDKVLRVRLSVGTYETVILGQSKSVDGNDALTTWRGAAGDAARQIDDWIKTNRTKLVQ